MRILEVFHIKFSSESEAMINESESCDMMVKRTELEPEDRLSKLPEPLLEHILSFLSFYEAGQMSTLSKGWLRLWHLCPNVELDESWLCSWSKPLYRYDIYNGSTQEALMKRRKLLCDLEQILQHRVRERISIGSFAIFMKFAESEFASFVDRCIWYALRCNVKELKLIIEFNNCYRLPQMVLSAESLRILHLSKCKLEYPFGTHSNLPSLKKLVLSRVDANDDVINDLIAKCPLLENLILAFCNFKKIEILSPQLISLLIWGCMDLVELKIETPRLSKLDYDGDSVSFHLKALALKICDLCLWSKGELDTQWKARSIDFLSKVRGFFKTLQLSSNFQIALIPLDLRRILSSPLYGVKHFNFQISSISPRFSVLEVLDGLLWMLPHPETITMSFSPFIRSFKFFYDEQLVYNEAACSKTHPVSCWQHCIKGVEVVVTDGTTKGISRSRYCFNGKGIWEKISLFENLGVLGY